jgi:hypothetical protein
VVEVIGYAKPSGLARASCADCAATIAPLVLQSRGWRAVGLTIRPKPEPTTGLPRYGPPTRATRRHSDPFEIPTKGIMGRISRPDGGADVVMTDGYVRSLRQVRATLAQGFGAELPIWVHCPACNAGQRLDPPSATMHTP